VLHGGSVVVLERGSVDLDALSIDHLAHLIAVSICSCYLGGSSYPRLEPGQVCWAQCVGLGYNRDQVDACA
jgi:hypothetical protein